jgi:hypothetical protein
MIFLLGGLLNFYMLTKKASRDLLKGFVGIQALVYEAVFSMAVFFPFFLPLPLQELYSFYCYWR